MNRKLIVTLLHKNIEELSMITESFMEMEEYPASIVHIAKRKTEDIQLLIEELSGIKEEKKVIIPTTVPTPEISNYNNSSFFLFGTTTARKNNSRRKNS